VSGCPEYNYTRISLQDQDRRDTFYGEISWSDKISLKFKRREEARFENNVIDLLALATKTSHTQGLSLPAALRANVCVTYEGVNIGSGPSPPANEQLEKEK